MRSGFSPSSTLRVYTQGEDRLLTIEHRCAAAPPPLRVRLKTTPAPHLVVVDGSADEAEALHAAVLERLHIVARPQSTTALRNVIKVRKATLVGVLQALEQQGRIERTTVGWTLISKENT